MSKQPICIRKCYLYETLWEPGEVFVPPFDGAKPNKHFEIDGKPVSDERVIRGPGDDPRSTPQMLADVQKFNPKVKDTTPRKRLFMMLQKHAASKKPVADPHNSGAKHNPSKATKNPVAAKLFTEMSPDDIDKIKVKEIREKLSQPPYSLELGKAVIAKGDLIKKGIKVEEDQSLSKAMG